MDQLLSFSLRSFASGQVVVSSILTVEHYLILQQARNLEQQLTANKGLHDTKTYARTVQVASLRICLRKRLKHTVYIQSTVHMHLTTGRYE